MTTERFNVVLRGGTLRGQDIATVATELARLIKRDIDLALRLLRGQPMQLKSGVDAATGARYVEALERIGVAVRLEPETLEVDAELSASPAKAAADQGRDPASVAGAKAGEPVQTEGKFRGDEQQSLATGGRRVSDSGNVDSKPEGAALAWPRLWARQIDAALCLAITVGLAVLAAAAHLLTTSISVQLAVVFLFLFVLIGYETLALGAFGTTFGKAALGLRVEKRTGTKIEFGRALRRTLRVLLLGCYVYSTWHSYRRLRKTGSTLWDDSCATRVAGGPVALWRTTLAGVIAITAPWLVVGLCGAIGQNEIKPQVRSAGLSPTPAATAALSNPFADPDFGRTPEPRGTNQASLQAQWDSAEPAAAPAATTGPSSPSAAPSIPQDYAEEIRQYRLGAERGQASAQVNLGTMYEQGHGVPQDYAEAIKWYRKAADQGDAIAQSNVGNMYHNGWGVAQDYAEAIKWYRKAADQGDALSQHALTPMYFYGQGVPQNYVEAYKWDTLATERFLASETKSSAEATKNLNAMATIMTPAQIAEAQRLAREWKPALPKNQNQLQTKLAPGSSCSYSLECVEPNQCVGSPPSCQPRNDPNFGKTPSFRASAQVKSKPEPVRHGANQATTDHEGTLSRSRYTSFLDAVRNGGRSDILAMIQAGADVNLRSSGTSPLIEAVRLSRYDVVELLIDAGADPNMSDSYDQRALFWAINRSDSEMISLLKGRGAR